jgi:hypothetical protein
MVTIEALPKPGAFSALQLVLEQAQPINNLALKLPREPVSGLLGIKPHRHE